MRKRTKQHDQDGRQNAKLDWEAVYAETLPKIFHYFCYRVGDTIVAEDLTSLTFEKAWAGRERFRSDIGSFTTWLFGIARHVVVDHYRIEKNELPLEEAAPGTEQNSPETAFQRNSDFSRLAKLLAGLPERERELISFKYGAELTNRAIAKLTGLSETNVGTILFRVVRKLRQAWEVIDEG
jgi:RNA polymerase sigma-70 factor (ECF subfamily)